MRMETQHAITDPYPTRFTDKEQWIDRQDPVVWGKWTPDAPLSREQTEFFEENGYLVLEGQFTEAEVERLKTACGQLLQEGDTLKPDTVITEPGSDEIRSIFQIEQQSDTFARLAADARVAGPIRFLLDEDIYLHQTRLNYKPGFDGKPFYWHSDFETWHAEDGMPRMRAISASILLTDNDALNGPLMLIPGTHKTFLSCAGETPDNNHEQSLKMQEAGTPSHDALEAMADTDKGIDYAPGKAGTVILFDCNTMHGSNGNITPNPRSNAFFVYNALSNAMTAPYAAKSPRPPFLAHRGKPEKLEIENGNFA